ncbi:MAG: NYN domain-containing protein [Desulfobacteraceae bacterium]|nr:MAG: NYN domain-containing protein [Desulfobacteraceae bacterium]
MLTHAHKGNYDIAILVAGDDDYVPLVKAVKDEGCRVVLWFFEKSQGLSRNLRLEADYFFDISWFLVKPQDELRKFYDW